MKECSQITRNQWCMAIISADERESGGEMASKFEANLGHMNMDGRVRQKGAGSEGRKRVR